MLDEKLFEPILDKNEQIKKMYAPDKKRAWFGVWIWIVLTSIVFVPAIILMFCSKNSEAISIAVISIIYAVLAISLPPIFVSLWCKKTVYAVTNKRIIIRTGYIGVDFKSLDFKMLGAIQVNVNLWDKLLRRNTGTISFGSMSSPLTTQTVAAFVCRYVSSPYETNKDIKAIIDENSAE